MRNFVVRDALFYPSGWSKSGAIRGDPDCRFSYRDPVAGYMVPIGLPDSGSIYVADSAAYIAAILRQVQGTQTRSLRGEPLAATASGCELLLTPHRLPL
jgi:hypothetical protein